MVSQVMNSFISLAVSRSIKFGMLVCFADTFWYKDDLGAGSWIYHAEESHQFQRFKFGILIIYCHYMILKIIADVLIWKLRCIWF